MITDGGDLLVSIPVGEVTWFDVLWHSRATNSLRGGWNFKDYWVDEFENWKSHPEMLYKWTKNSLELGASEAPASRTGRFKFDRQRSTAHISAAERPFLVGRASENTLIRALAEASKLKLSDGRLIEILGYEIPLSSSAKGQLKADLYGWSADQLEIIEMKKAHNKGDSPLFAFVELACYLLQSLRSWGALSKDIKGLSGKVPNKLCEATVTSFGVTVAAPDEYWKYWGDGNMADLLIPISEAIRAHGYCQTKLTYLEKTLKDIDFAI